MTRSFSRWVRWRDRGKIADLGLPGVYAVARFRGDLTGQEFTWRSDVIYVGMTNSQGGLMSRIQQFDGTLRGMDLHGGAHRVRFKYPDYNALASLLFVSVCPFRCDVKSNDPRDLRIMGRVASFEYECFAAFAEVHGRLPEFNDKKRSPKKLKKGEPDATGNLDSAPMNSTTSIELGRIPRGA